MAYISPILKSKLNLNNTNKQPAPMTSLSSGGYDATYERLIRRANDVQPNEAKAKLVDENFITATISGVKDTGKDIANFTTAVRTGKMNDTKLGRINDLGMKTGAALIALLLAANSKTKFDAIMKFVGGGAFIASMSLWPKLFINLPAKLVHGFDIDRKYVNAQGDKKDFFLDNQFIPWDAYSKEEIAEIGKKLGIDPNSKNAQEKIQRKMQKVALQSRTLWMATAGFATPIMASLISNRLEKPIADALNRAERKKAYESYKQIREFGNATEAVGFDGTPVKCKNQEAIEELIKQYSENKLEPDDFFYKEMVRLTESDKILSSIDPEDARMLEEAIGVDLEDVLKIIRKSAAGDGINVEMVEEFVSKLKLITETTGDFEELVSIFKEGADKETILFKVSNLSSQTLRDQGKELFGKLEFVGDKLKNTPEEIENIVRTTFGNTVDNSIPKELLDEIVNEVKKQPTADKLKKLLRDHQISFKEADIDPIRGTGLNEFYEKAKYFATEEIPIIQTRLKQYVKTLSAFVGSKASAKTTEIFDENMATMFKQLGLSQRDVKEIAMGGRKKSIFRKIKELFENIKNDPKVMAERARMAEERLTDESPAVKKLYSAFSDKIQTMKKDPKNFSEEYTKFLANISGDPEIKEGFGAKVLKLLKIKPKDDGIPAGVKKIQPSLSDELSDMLYWLSANENLGKLESNDGIPKSFTKGKILSNMQKVVEDKLLEMETLRIRPVLCANLERRILEGEFAPEDIRAARRIVYDNSLSLMANGAYLPDALFLDGKLVDERLTPQIFDLAKFSREEKNVMRVSQRVATEDGLSAFLEKMKNIVIGRYAKDFDLKYYRESFMDDSKKYIMSSGLAKATKRYAEKVYNDKVWLKTFGAIGTVLALGTIFAQFAFGKIDKEFPQEQQGGNK